MSSTRGRIRAIVMAAALAAVAIVVPTAVAASSAAAASPARTSIYSGPARPTIVLVHGAWADGSSWAPVVTRLQRRQLTMAQRAHSQIVRVPAPHLAMLAKPDAVTDLIVTAARATS